MPKLPVYICSGCGGIIREGERVWHVLGEQFCRKCIDKAGEEAVLYDAD